MNPTAKKCVQWAVIMFVIGVGALAFGPHIYSVISNTAGSNAQAGMDFLNIVILVLTNACLPTGGALIGAAVIINTLKPLKSPEEQETLTQR